MIAPYLSYDKSHDYDNRQGHKRWKSIPENDGYHENDKSDYAEAQMIDIFRLKALYNFIKRQENRIDER